MPRYSCQILAVAVLLGLGCAADAPQPVVIAHRGASGLAPEHTWAAYTLAIEQGADFIEQDLHFTRDGVLVALHDDTLDRTARGPAGSCTGLAGEKTLAELERCDFGAWFDEQTGRADFAGQRIVALDALFTRFGERARYYIETKHPDHAPGMEEALVSLLAAHDLLPGEKEASRVIVQSFSPESLRKIHAREPGIPLVQLLGGDFERPLAEVFDAIAEYAIGIGPHKDQVDAELMAEARRHGLVVHSYTVNTRDEMIRLLDLGVDGLFTDRPDRLIEFLEER